MARKYPNKIQMNISGDYLLDRLAPKLSVQIKQMDNITPANIKQAIQKVLLNEFYMQDISTMVCKFHQTKLNMSISGTLGRISYAQSKIRQEYSRRRPTQPPQPTPLRLFQRDYMRQAIIQWNKLNDIIKQKWNHSALSYKKSGTNLFRGVYMILLIDNKPIPNPLLPDPVLLQYYFNRKKNDNNE